MACWWCSMKAFMADLRGSGDHPMISESAFFGDFKGHRPLPSTTHTPCIRALVDQHYPRATKIRLVQDNLNTHDGASLDEAFRPEEARRLLDKIEFQYRPKHGSWLNMAETEINIMDRQCLNRRLDSQGLIAEEVAAWENERNAREARID